jgi:hypothetical protein
MSWPDLAVAWVFLGTLFIVAVILRACWRWSAKWADAFFNGAADDVR